MFQATCEKVVFGGKGLIRHDGMVVFVDDVLPGEEITFELTKQKKNYGEGKLVEVVSPSPDRVAPKCPYFGVCGGCQLQHMAYTRQAQAKREWVGEALCHKTGFSGPVTIIRAEKEWEYRKKITLHFDASGTLGYYARDNQTLLNIDFCPIFSEEAGLFAKVKKFLEGNDCEGALTVFKSKRGPLLRFSFPYRVPELLQKRELDCAWSLESPRECIVRGVLEEEVLIDGLKITVSPKAFIQNYPEQSLNIYRDVVAAATSDRVLDLYCGIGILSALMARKGKEVVGIEISREAVLLAEKNARANNVPHLRFICGPVEAKLSEKYKTFPTWIVNPPREGLEPRVVKTILDFQPEKLIYISCNPMTLKRDVERLVQNHYTIIGAKAYDMFPQTTHVETMVSLERR